MADIGPKVTESRPRLAKVPKLIITKADFDLWAYEKELIPKGAFILFLLYLFCIIEFVVFPTSKSSRLLPWFLAFFYVIPFLMLAVGKLMPAGKDLYTWHPRWGPTSHLRRWFRTQYTIAYASLALLSYIEGNLLCCIGFAVLAPVFITYTWLLESEVRITKHGIATYTGVLNWRDISAIYHVPRPWKVKAAIESAFINLSANLDDN